jgi:hypothetical protein
VTAITTEVEDSRSAVTFSTVASELHELLLGAVLVEVGVEAGVGAVLGVVVPADVRGAKVVDGVRAEPLAVVVDVAAGGGSGSEIPMWWDACEIQR